MHVMLTASSLVYVVTSLGKTVYSISLAKEHEEHALVLEGVHSVYNSYVRDLKRRGEWGPIEKARARQLVVDYVRRNGSRMCRCFSSGRPRLVTWINDAVATLRAKSKPKGFTIPPVRFVDL